MKRRHFLALSSLAAVQAGAQSGRFQPPQDVTPLIRKLADGMAPAEGGIEIELPQIAENGNSVPMRIRLDSPMTAADHVSAIHIIAERNPRPLVASFHLGPASGKAEVSTRVRLAGTQKVRVLAELSGKRFRLVQRDVLVTSAACLDESL